MMRRWLREYGFVVLVCAVITLVQIQYVGNFRIYQEDLRQKRLEMHEAILANSPPAGTTWGQIGANGVNSRVGVVYMVEIVHNIAYINILFLYKLIDALSIFIYLFLIYLFLNYWHPKPYCLIGVLLTGAILPLTYALHCFHPWDRISLVFWLVLLFALRRNRLITFTLVLPISMIFKNDTLILPGLYFIANIGKNNWRHVTVVTSLLSVMTLGLNFALVKIYQDGLVYPDYYDMFKHNISVIIRMNIDHPTILGLLIPALLALIGYKHGDKFSRSCAIFTVIPLSIAMAMVNFREIRALMPVFVLLMPLALFGLRNVLGDRMYDEPLCTRNKNWNPISD